jgi:hypothetical protein
MHYVKVFLLFVVLAGFPATGQAQENPFDPSGSIVTGSVWELRNSRRLLLIVRRSNVVDSRGQAKAIINEVYKANPEAPVRYPRLFNSLARKLNKYMNKRRNITAAKNVSDADFIIFFNLLEIRRPLGVPYPYGEMFVILNDRSGVKPPRIVWKTRENSMWAEDAIEEFINDLKMVRGEN